MLILIAGVLLWSFAHLFKRLAPSLRQSMGQAGKGFVAIAILVSVVLMVMGYSNADTVVFWGRHPATVGINNLLMLLSVYLMVVSFVKSGLANRVQHPQLSALKTWAIAHLLVNGDTASFVLFGGLLVWAVVTVIWIGKTDKIERPQRPLSLAREFIALGLSVIVFGAIAMAHMALGYPVFG